MIIQGCARFARWGVVHPVQVLFALVSSAPQTLNSPWYLVQDRMDITGAPLPVKRLRQ
jgi:hypothetical protein